MGLKYLAQSVNIFQPLEWKTGNGDETMLQANEENIVQFVNLSLKTNTRWYLRARVLLDYSPCVDVIVQTGETRSCLLGSHFAALVIISDELVSMLVIKRLDICSHLTVQTNKLQNKKYE